MLTHDPELQEMMRVAADLERAATKPKMYAGGWVQLINWQMDATAAVAKNNYTAIADLMVVPQPYIPANSVQVGTQWIISAWGTIGSAAGTATTIMNGYLNGAASGTALGTAMSAQTPPTATALPWQAQWNISVQTLGSSGSIWALGSVMGISASGTTTVLMPSSTMSAITFNSTQANYFTVAASWSSAATGNTYTVYGLTVQQLN